MEVFIRCRVKEQVTSAIPCVACRKFKQRGRLVRTVWCMYGAALLSGVLPSSPAFFRFCRSVFTVKEGCGYKSLGIGFRFVCLGGFGLETSLGG